MYKRENDEHIKHPSCRSIISRKQFSQIAEVGYNNTDSVIFTNQSDRAI